MTSDKTVPPTFITDKNVPVDIPFPAVKRNIVVFDFSTDVSNDLKHRTYSIPSKADFPFLDAFTVDISYSNMSAILRVIQITTSRSYGGSALGRASLAHLWKYASCLSFGKVTPTT